MAFIWKGSTALTLVHTEVGKDPNSGLYTELLFNGPAQMVMGEELSLRNNRNVITRRWHEGPIHFLSVRYGSESLAEDPPVDTWTTSFESLDKDLFFSPDVNAEAGGFGAHDYRKQIEDALSSGEDLTSPGIGDLTYAPRVLFELARGGSHYEDEFFVVRGKRCVPRYYTQKVTLRAGKPLIYSTGQLPVPTDILAKLPGQTGNPFPADPPTYPDGTASAIWGWKKRGPTTDYEGNKAIISVEFVCAAWSALSHEASTALFSF